MDDKMNIDQQLLAIAERIADRANECCHRNDGYEEDIRDFALEEMRRVIAGLRSVEPSA